MRYLILFKQRYAHAKDAIARGLEFKFPPDVKVLGAYMLQTPYPNMIIILEADSLAPVMATTVFWSDLFEATVLPAMTMEEVLQAAREMTS